MRVEEETFSFMAADLFEFNLKFTAEVFLALDIFLIAVYLDFKVQHLEVNYEQFVLAFAHYLMQVVVKAIVTVFHAA